MISKDRKKHINIIIFVSLLLYVFSMSFYYLYSGEQYLKIINFILYPLLYPTLLFTIGTIVCDKEDNKELLSLAFDFFRIGLTLNIIKLLVYSYIESEVVYSVLYEINIFIFVSIFILLGHFIKTKIDDGRSVWGIGFLLAILNLVLSIIFENNTFFLLKIFVSNQVNTSSFPILGFMIFPCTGYAIRYYARDFDKDKHLKWAITGIIGYIGILLYLRYGLQFVAILDFSNLSFFYNMHILYALALILLCIGLYNLMFIISKKVSKKLYEKIEKISDRYRSISVISYIIILLVHLYLYKSLLDMNAYQILFIAIIIGIISIPLSKFMNKILQKSK